MNMTDEGDGMASVDTGVGAFVALADVAHGSGPNWLLKGFGGNPTVGFGGRADADRDSDESVATSLFVEVRTICYTLCYSTNTFLVFPSSYLCLWYVLLSKIVNMVCRWLQWMSVGPT